MTSPLKEILSGTFLSFTAKNLGHQWKEFFTRLNFESHHFVHWETDNLKFSDEPIIIGLKEWIKRPLVKNLLSYRNIEEIKDWLVLILNLECGRKDISDDIQKNYKDMDEIIEMLTEKVTTDRPSLFGALEIDWKSIEDNLPTGESLKKRTGACLNTWFTEQQVKYWKYQELLLTFRDSNLDSGANSIIERFGIKELKDARNYFEAAKQEALPLGKEKDSHLYANTSFVGSSDTNQQILIQQSPSDKELSTKSDDVTHMTNKRPLEEAIVEKGERKKKVKASRKEKITETEEDMEIVHFDNIESEDMHDTHSDEDATITDGFQKSLINLRDYQQELADLALKGVNTIVCAGTNAGKTYVALKVIESHIEKNTAGKVVFMTRTNVLLGQQFDTACKLLPGLSSKGKIQKWEAGQEFTSGTFKSLVNRCSILFLTPKSLCNFLEDEFSRVNIDQFTLLVLDECHHTYGKSPYNEIMGHYRKKKFENEQNNLPQIMGLTASPGTNRAKDKFGAKEHLIHIMTNLDVKKLSVVKECESSLLKYSSKAARVPILSKKRSSKGKTHGSNGFCGRHSR
ncbi:interferon-induced helicase C domain-containing protein 1-like isoform X4 [Mytilus edulis]|uniref:interferon-induced helicase C domain-containing protein 1-like isoform X4 n=1 Tax=Mytilus edulis TaxID=6550 RepID=UPI0039F0CAEC